jgi:nitrogen-specific signal transduction histidine kinase
MLRNSPSWSGAEVAKLIGLLRQGASYAETILERLPVGVALISRDGQIEYANSFANSCLPDLDSTVQTLSEHLQVVFQTGAAGADIGPGIDSNQICLHPFDKDHVLLIVTVSGSPDSDSPFRALSQVASPVAVVSESDGILFANEAFSRVSGFSPAEIIGKDVLTFHDAIADFSTPESRTAATLFPRCGNPVRVELSRRPIVCGHTPAAVVTITAENIEPVTPDECAMPALERVCGQVAHRFNNLLTVVLAYTDLIATQYKAVDPLKSDLDCITQAANQMSDLAQDLLVFSHGRPTSPVPVAVDRVVSGMANMFQAIAGSTPVNIHTDTNSACVHLAVKELETILLNLVRNAKEAVRSNTAAITITTFRLAPGTPEYEAIIPQLSLAPKTFLCITVADAGAGTASGHNANLFEPFFTTKPGASGLGLSVAYGIVKRAGGGMVIDTNAGVGTTARVVLPESGL